jgi:hypothetical protein
MFVILHILQYLLSCDCVILHCYHLIDKIRFFLVNITTYTITIRTNIFVKKPDGIFRGNLSIVNCQLS